MSLYGRPVCVACKRWMSRKKNGVAVHLGVHTQHIHADLFECTECGTQTIHGWASGYCNCDKEIFIHVE